MKYGLIGQTLGHSYSQQIHERIASYPYELCSLAPDELEGFMQRADFEGINVTIPYKKAVIPFLDSLSPEARRIGSVNTIVRNKGKLQGFNTDYHGFLFLAQRAGISFEGQKVLILGTGGTSAMVQAAVAGKGASEVTVVSRSGKINYTNVYEQSDAQIIINTTPVGMFPRGSERICELERFSQLVGVLDVIYNPLQTNLICDAQELGIKAMGGLPMLVEQAVVASELFTGSSVDDAARERVLREITQQVQNVVLIGMPGSGKSTAGQKLGVLLQREFIDIDECITQEAGLSIPEIFAQRGEAEFRSLEHECISRISQLSGVVIATGGGAVLDPENMRALARNGRIYYLECALDKLATTGRPLSSSDSALEKLYQQRHPLYKKYSDVCVNRDDSLDPALAIEEDFNEISGC